MSLSSVFKALNPFASAAATDLDKAIAAVEQKANADIAALKLNAGRQADAKARADRVAAWNAVKTDYEKYLAGASAVPSPAPTGATGPSGAA